MELDFPPGPAAVLSVSQLLRSARDALERRFPLQWISGEVSNLRPAAWMMANKALSFERKKHFLCAHFSQTPVVQQLRRPSDAPISTKDVDKFVDYP